MGSSLGSTRAGEGGGPLNLQFFHDHNFVRRRCPACGYWFWALPASGNGGSAGSGSGGGGTGKGAGSGGSGSGGGGAGGGGAGEGQGDDGFVHGDLCGDAPCVEYSFLGAPVIPKAYDLDGMRELFLGFFQKRGHTRLARYPVVARWRKDIYLTIASIADFQPHVTSGLVEPPANPLTISQPCIRLNDMASVGRSGRHLTNFEMMAHHAFNSPAERIYWQEATVAYCHELYTDELHIKPEMVTYKENPWVGGGNGGQALEVLAGGLELATLVFMDLVEDPAGPVELKGQRFSEQELSIVDTGYGLERMVWASRGTSTLYEALYPQVVEFISQEAGVAELLADPDTARLVGLNARVAGVLNVDLGTNLAALREQVLVRLRREGLTLSMSDLLATIEPLERVFSVADHARCLVFMFGDGVVPSSNKAGYLARMVTRRALGLLDQLGCPDLLGEVARAQLKQMKAFPGLQRARDRIMEIIELEQERYRETLQRGRRAVGRYLAERPGAKLGVDQLVHFYESAGLPPQVVAEEAARHGLQVEVPADFTARVALAHSGEQAEAAPVKARSFDLPPTEPLYYTRPDTAAFQSKVLWAEGRELVLATTAFYPEGGGQPCDLGRLEWGPGEGAEVTEVQKHQGVIVHTLDSEAPAEGTSVKGVVDWERRMAHLRHHTGTHIVGAAARKLLGPHIWQAGAAKFADRARLDLTHYRRLTPEQLEAIEREANAIVLADEPVERVELDRAEADARYGPVLYQGGVPPGGRLRVVRIGERTDVQACGGTHASHTGQVGYIKLLSSTRIQEGVERLEFAAGPAAVAAVQTRERWLRSAAAELGVPPDRLPATARRFFAEWKERGKQVEKLQAQLAKGTGSGLASREVAGVTLHYGLRPGADMAELQSLARELTKAPRTLALLGALPVGATAAPAALAAATPAAPTATGAAPAVAAKGEGQGMLLAATGPEAPEGLHCGKILQAGAAAGGGRGGGKPSIAQGACPAKGVEAAVAAMVEAARGQLDS